MTKHGDPHNLGKLYLPPLEGESGGWGTVAWVGSAPYTLHVLLSLPPSVPLFSCTLSPFCPVLFHPSPEVLRKHFLL